MGIFRVHTWLILEASLWSAFMFSPRASFRNLPLAYSQSTDNFGEDPCVFFVHTHIHASTYTHTLSAHPLSGTLCGGGLLLDSFGWELGKEDGVKSFEKTW